MEQITHWPRLLSQASSFQNYEELIFAAYKNTQALVPFKEVWMDCDKAFQILYKIRIHNG